MFGYRVISCIKERTHYYIQPFCATQTFESFLTKFHTNKAKQYCRNINSQNGQNLVNGIFQVDSKYGKELLKTDLCKESDHKNLKNKENAISETFQEGNQIELEGIMKNYTQPVHSIHCIYSIVSKEQCDNNVFSINYKRIQNKQLSNWKCMISVSWPEKKQFVAYGKDKMSAKRVAAWECLHWLKMLNKIRDNKPLLYSEQEIKELLTKPTKLRCNFEILEEAKELLRTYERSIDGIIRSYDSASNIKSMSYFDTFNNNRTASFSESLLRNKQLLDKLLKRDVNKNQDLPIFQYREEILEKLEHNQVILIRGNTGCGKSTQVPQIIMDHFIRNENAHNCNILISEPRRISTTSLAQRVAFERGESIGDVVGYSIRFERVPPKYPGGMHFCTTGILTNIMQKDPNLLEYSHVILDESHERTIEIDTLFVLLKRALKNNPSLKVIVMSATINTEKFQRYFNCPCIDVPGKTYPVKMHYLEDFQDVLISTKQNANDSDENNLMPDYENVVNVIKWISSTKPPGTILCFLPGWAEITSVAEFLTKDKSMENQILVIPIHSKLLNINQRKIFEATPKNVRKIILATNIAETGITVPDVVYVVDTAVSKEYMWNKSRMIIFMNYSRISQANIQQRKGRAGRTMPGESYHFIEKEEYDGLDPYPIPEVFRTCLQNAVMEIKNYTTGKIEEFTRDMLDPPDEQVLSKAIHELMDLGLLDQNENLTLLGQRVSNLMLYPSMGKAAVLSTIFECTDPIVHIATFYVMNGIFFGNLLDNKEFLESVKQRYHTTSDHLATFIIFKEWMKIRKQPQYKVDFFCDSVCISPSKIRLTLKLHELILNNLSRCDLLPEKCNANSFELPPDKYAQLEEIIYGILLSSTNKLIRLNPVSYVNGIFKKKRIFRNEENLAVLISRSSVNYSKHPSYMIYLDSINLNMQSILRVHDTSVISPLTIIMFTNDTVYYAYDDSEASGNIIIKRGNRIKLRFSCSREEAEIIISFRDVLWSVVNYFVAKKVSDMNSPTDELNTMIKFKSELLYILSRMLNDAKDKDVS